MHKFRLTIILGELTLYQAVYTLTEDQYQALLQLFRKEGTDVLDSGDVEEATGEAFDDSKDYAVEHPDVIVGAIICQRASNKLFSPDWVGFNALDKAEFSECAVAVDNTNFSWTCVRVD